MNIERKVYNSTEKRMNLRYYKTLTGTHTYRYTDTCTHIYTDTRVYIQTYTHTPIHIHHCSLLLVCSVT